MIIRDVTFPNPEDNILYDEALLSLAEDEGQGEALRFWESPVPFIVLGLTGREDEELDLEAVRRDRVPVLRRASGGGTVCQGPGCLNFSLVLTKGRHPDLRDIRRSYAYILTPLVKALNECGITAALRPLSDVVLLPGEKKISGNAQKRSRNFLLHHGTVLFRYPLEVIARYQKIPREMPAYRQERPHAGFVTNAEVDAAVLKTKIAAAWQAGADFAGISRRELEMLFECRARRAAGPRQVRVL